MYPVVFFDALRVKIRDEGSVRNKAVYLALGIQRDGTKDVLGIWIGAKRRSEVLARGDERAQKPKDPGYADRGHRWIKGLP